MISENKLRSVKRTSDVILIKKLKIVYLKQNIFAEAKRFIEKKKGDR